jgi:purine nucleoside phosphorylase
MRQKPKPEVAKRAGEAICRLLKIQDARIGLVLGTGWGQAMPLRNARAIPFSSISPVFHGLPELDGHDRSVVGGRIEGIPVLALRGRVHLNEAPADPDLYDMVRLQVAMLIEAGCRTLIVTSAVGSLDPLVKVGDVVVPDGLFTLFAPPMPLYAGEFVSPEDVIDQKLVNRVLEESRRPDGWEPPFTVHRGCHCMVRGPFFEGRNYDKAALRMQAQARQYEAKRLKLFVSGQTKAVVGMSLLPELCVAGLFPGVTALPLMFVTNSDSEEHSHESNQARAKQSAAALGDLLTNCVRLISQRQPTES